jgi:4'-phosphopantetheinyl transferase
MSSSVPRDQSWLTQAERAVLGAMTIPKRAGDWRIGRWIAKEAIRRCLGAPGLAGAELEILASPGGAPTLRVLGGGAWPEVSLSLSHTWGMGFAAAVAAEVRIGCDVEALRPRSDAFVSDYFTASEADFVRRADPMDQPAHANLVWSAKESALKALGEGLRLDTRSVEVTLTREPSVSGWQALAVATPGAGRMEGHWRLTAGFVWTLVLDVAVGRLEGAPVG